MLRPDAVFNALSEEIQILESVAGQLDPRCYAAGIVSTQTFIKIKCTCSLTANPLSSKQNCLETQTDCVLVWRPFCYGTASGVHKGVHRHLNFENLKKFQELKKKITISRYFQHFQNSGTDLHKQVFTGFPTVEQLPDSRGTITN